jgi:hypothetical protein
MFEKYSYVESMVEGTGTPVQAGTINMLDFVAVYNGYL